MKKNFNETMNVKRNRVMNVNASMKMQNGNDFASREVKANGVKIVNFMRTDSTVSNCEVATNDSLQLKLSISLPWGGEAKIELNGSTQVASSVLAQKELNEMANESAEKTAKLVAHSIEWTMEKVKDFMINDMPEIGESIRKNEMKSLEHEHAKDLKRKENAKESLNDEFQGKTIDDGFERI